MFPPGGVMVTPPEELRTRFRQHRADVDTRVCGDVAVTTLEEDFDPDGSCRTCPRTKTTRWSRQLGGAFENRLADAITITAAIAVAVCITVLDRPGLHPAAGRRRRPA